MRLRRAIRLRHGLLRFKARPLARLSRPNPMHACSGFARQKPPDCEEKRDPCERYPGTRVQSELDPTARVEKRTLDRCPKADLERSQGGWRRPDLLLKLARAASACSERFT